MRTHEISIDVQVQDRHELFNAALERAKKDGLGESHARELLEYEDGDVNIGACLSILLDPGSLAGCSIIQTSCD